MSGILAPVLIVVAIIVVGIIMTVLVMRKITESEMSEIRNTHNDRVRRRREIESLKNL